MVCGLVVLPPGCGHSTLDFAGANMSGDLLTELHDSGPNFLRSDSPNAHAALRNSTRVLGLRR